MNQMSTIRHLFPPQAKLEQFCKQQDITYLGLFGSHVRGEAKKDSDVDLLIDYPRPKSLFALGGIVADLEEMLGKKVDLVKRDRIKKLIRPFILKEAITLYDEKK